MAFTTVLTGTVGVVTGCVVTVLLLWSAALCLRRERLGWIVSLLLVVGLRASLTCFYAGGGTPDEVFRPELAGTTGAAASVRPHWHYVALSGAETLAVLALGLYVSRHFSTGYTMTLAAPAARDA